MGTFAGAGVRTGRGGDSKAEARHSMDWHRKHGLWLTSRSWEKHWEPGMTVIAAQSGEGRGRFMRGEALDSDTLDRDPSIVGWMPDWQYAKRVAWGSETFIVPPAGICEPVQRMLKIRTLTWLDDDDLKEVLANLVVMR